MNNVPLIRKCLVVGSILLFSGVAIAPTITFITVKAAHENDLVEVTTQVCGIEGFKDTIVKLTRQQYQDLEQYLIAFKERLNQTTTQEEAVLIVMEAVVELNTYGLLPKGMSVERAQRLITGWYQKPIEKVLNNWNRVTFPNLVNAFCLLYLDVTRPSDSDIPFVIVYGPLIFILLPLAWISEIFSRIVRYIYDRIQNIPLKFFNIIDITAITDFYSIGLKFCIRKTHSYTPLSLVGYTGLILRPSADKAYFFGFSVAVTSV